MCTYILGGKRPTGSLSLSLSRSLSLTHTHHCRLEERKTHREHNGPYQINKHGSFVRYFKSVFMEAQCDILDTYQHVLAVSVVTIPFFIFTVHNNVLDHFVLLLVTV